MAKLPDGLIQRFLAATHDKHKETTERTYYGTISGNGVILDGSNRVTPIANNGAEYVNGDRVEVTIKDHTAVISSNFTKPSTNEEAVESAINEFNSVISNELNGMSTAISQNAENINLAIKKANNAQDSADAAQGTANTASTNAYNATQLLGNKVDKGDVVTEVNLSTDGVQIYGDRFEVYASNCAIDAQGNAVFYQAQFPGGIKLGDVTQNSNEMTWTDKHGVTHTIRSTGGAVSPIWMYKDGIGIVCQFFSGSTGTVTRNIAFEDDLAAFLTDSDLNGYAKLTDLNGKSDVGHTHTIDNVFSYGTAATQYWVTQNFESKSSDIRLKKNIESMSVNRVKKFYESLKPVSYNFKMEPSKKSFGLIAQDILEQAHKYLYLDEEELDLVGKNTQPSDKEKEIVGDDSFYTVNYNQLHAFHITMIQELMKKNEELEARIKKLEEEKNG